MNPSLTTDNYDIEALLLKIRYQQAVIDRKNDMLRKCKLHMPQPRQEGHCAEFHKELMGEIP